MTLMFFNQSMEAKIQGGIQGTIIPSKNTLLFTEGCSCSSASDSLPLPFFFLFPSYLIYFFWPGEDNNSPVRIHFDLENNLSIT